MENQKQNHQMEDDDRFARFMFGPRREMNRKVEPTSTETKQPSIDYSALMENIDILMRSTENLKPLVKKVYPFVEQLWKKK